MHRTVLLYASMYMLLAPISHISAKGFEAEIRVKYERVQPIAVDSILKVLSC